MLACIHQAHARADLGERWASWLVHSVKPDLVLVGTLESQSVLQVTATARLGRSILAHIIGLFTYKVKQFFLGGKFTLSKVTIDIPLTGNDLLGHTHVPLRTLGIDRTEFQLRILFPQEMVDSTNRLLRVAKIPFNCAVFLGSLFLLNDGFGDDRRLDDNCISLGLAGLISFLDQGLRAFVLLDQLLVTAIYRNEIQLVVILTLLDRQLSRHVPSLQPQLQTDSVRVCQGFRGDDGPEFGEPFID